MKNNIPHFPDVATFEQFYNDYLDRTNPTRLRVKPKPTKFKLTKRKVVKKRIEEVRTDENGIPHVHVISPVVTKEVPDTNQFTKLIIAYFESVLGCKSVRRISSEGRFRPNKAHPNGGTWLPGVNNGIEDVQAIVNGRLVAVEVKFTKTDRMRPEQIKRMNEVEADGGVYIVAREFGEFQNLIKSIL